MRRLLVCALAALALAGCSVLSGAYDEQAREECEHQPASDRGGCLDRVDQQRRERDQR